MVHTNVNYFGYPLPVLVEFGKGDVLVTTGESDTQHSIVFKNIEPTPLGTDMRSEIEPYKDKAVTDMQPNAIIQFTASKSVDVLIEALQLVREELIKKGL